MSTANPIALSSVLFLKILILHEGESTFIHKSMMYQFINLVKFPLEVIEVQNFEYLVEDDIVRFRDKYGRIDRHATSQHHLKNENNGGIS